MMKGRNNSKINLMLGLSSLFLTVILVNSLQDMARCQTDNDCQDVLMCRQQGEPCQCYHGPSFSNDDVFGPRCVKLSWVQKIRQSLERRLENSDIGPDTCGKDRTILGQW